MLNMQQMLKQKQQKVETKGVDHRLIKLDELKTSKMFSTSNHPIDKGKTSCL